MQKSRGRQVKEMFTRIAAAALLALILLVMAPGAGFPSDRPDPGRPRLIFICLDVSLSMPPFWPIITDFATQVIMQARAGDLVVLTVFDDTFRVVDPSTGGFQTIEVFDGSLSYEISATTVDHDSRNTLLETIHSIKPTGAWTNPDLICLGIQKCWIDIGSKQLYSVCFVATDDEPSLPEGPMPGPVSKSEFRNRIFDSSGGDVLILKANQGTGGNSYNLLGEDGFRQVSPAEFETAISEHLPPKPVPKNDTPLPSSAGHRWLWLIALLGTALIVAAGLKYRDNIATMLGFSHGPDSAISEQKVPVEDLAMPEVINQLKSLGSIDDDPCLVADHPVLNAGISVTVQFPGYDSPPPLPITRGKRITVGSAKDDDIFVLEAPPGAVTILLNGNDALEVVNNASEPLTLMPREQKVEPEETVSDVKPAEELVLQWGVIRFQREGKVFES